MKLHKKQINHSSFLQFTLTINNIAIEDETIADIPEALVDHSVMRPFTIGVRKREIAIVLVPIPMAIPISFLSIELRDMLVRVTFKIALEKLKGKEKKRMV